MPLMRFICPDKESIGTKACLQACRMEQRCLTRATLMVIAGTSHEWDGVPHVTSLLNGTMMEYLKITRDYAIDPKDRAFALLGSSHHKLLESSSVQEVEWGKQEQHTLGDNGSLSELALNLGWIQGTLDLIEADGDELVLTDFKTWGSMRLARNKPVGVVFDPRAGYVDLSDVTLQMNMYRIMAEQQYELVVSRMQVQCTVRDGGLAIATKRGVKENIYLIPVHMLPDNVVLSYFKTKAARLENAMEFTASSVLGAGMSAVEPCSDDERWGGNRCRSYCEVASYCPVGVQYI